MLDARQLDWSIMGVDSAFENVSHEVVAVVGWLLAVIVAVRGAAAFVLLLLWTTAGRALSATCTAPPPMIAPPQVQAHNLAKAIRTDIGIHSCLVAHRSGSERVRLPFHKSAEEKVNRKVVNSESCRQVH